MNRSPMLSEKNHICSIIYSSTKYHVIASIEDVVSRQKHRFRAIYDLVINRYKGKDNNSFVFCIVAFKVCAIKMK